MIKRYNAKICVGVHDMFSVRENGNLSINSMILFMIFISWNKIVPQMTDILGMADTQRVTMPLITMTNDRKMTDKLLIKK